jgi:hypothetical protein
MIVVLNFYVDLYIPGHTVPVDTCKWHAGGSARQRIFPRDEQFAVRAGSLDVD